MSSSAKLETGIPLELSLVNFSPYLCPASTPSQRLGTAEASVRASHDLNIWITPEVLPGFGEFMFTLYETLSATALLILEAWALGLGLSDPGKLLKLHSGMNNQLRLLHYPPIAARELEEGSSARMEEQSDWGSITLLFQDACGGLEVQVKDGE
ncbi:uncharacterized protein L3040_005790 [Drepanopeziza brunnea f. sp. 'multigermtubi']|uniref:uncharacterized protein n=1 Tax=Drepanopeziza brunnea f. sp. 'multigermtubi' TaxID=698441 RepID=UPI002389B6B4|nr:hypothetical protein L3040_005790 [Drepanopeziza brunnea f. sp. 'multigermtubi']